MTQPHTLQVALVSPERELWAGTAEMVSAKTLEGDVGVLGGHQPLLGVLVEGGVVRVRRGGEGNDLAAAVNGGFLSVSDDQVSILAEDAELGSEVDVESARREWDESSGAEATQDEASRARAVRAKARLVAAGHEV